MIGSTIYLILFILILLAMKKDPSDPMIYKCKDDPNIWKNFECMYWQSFVSSEAKHWKSWNRWVLDFDHHCIWLNNWVGYNNYRYFFSIIIIGSIFSFFILGLTILVIVKAERLKYIDPATVTRVYLAVFLVAKLIITVLIWALTSFHIYLYYKGLSTFEFLCGDKPRKGVKQEPKKPR